MKTLLTLILISLSILGKSQQTFSLEMGKTLKTDYNIPYFSLNYGYLVGKTVFDLGIRTNWSEYYTEIHSSVGLQTNSKLYLSGNIGYGWLFSIPQLDRHIENGKEIILSPGYSEKSLFGLYLSGKAGYEVIKNVTLFSSGSYICNRYWIGSGIQISIK